MISDSTLAPWPFNPSMTHSEITQKYREIQKNAYDKSTYENREYRIVTDPTHVQASMAKNLAHAGCSQSEQKNAFDQEDKRKMRAKFRYDSFPNDDHSSVPGLEKIKPVTVGSWKVGVASCRGARSQLEDTFYISPEEITLSFRGIIKKAVAVGVFDGHEGKDVAKSLSDTIQGIFLNQYEKFSNKFPDIDTAIYNSLIHSFVIASEGRMGCGSTAAFALLIDNKAYVANLGDCRTIYQPPSGQPVALSDDAKAPKERFVRHVKSRGGFVALSRINATLETMAAVGDNDLLGIKGTPCVPHRAQVTCYPIDPKGSLILGSDGFWDCAPTEDVGKVACQQASENLPPNQIAENLLYASYKGGSEDNITVMMVRGCVG